MRTAAIYSNVAMVTTFEKYETVTNT